MLIIGEEQPEQQQQRQLINTNAPYSDIYVARFDKDGKLEWATSWGGEGVRAVLCLWATAGAGAGAGAGQPP